jgi:hypothetical protein
MMHCAPWTDEDKKHHLSENWLNGGVEEVGKAESGLLLQGYGLSCCGGHCVFAHLWQKEKGLGNKVGSDHKVANDLPSLTRGSMDWHWQNTV